MVENPRRSGGPASVIVIVLGVVACLCACIAALGGGAAYLAVKTNGLVTQLSTQVQPQLTEVFPQPTRTPRPGVATAPADGATASPAVNLTPVPTPVAGST